MSREAGLQALSARILSQARERADEMIRGAEERAEAVERQARNAAEGIRRAVVAEAESAARRERRRSEATAHLEAKRRLLVAREELITRALARAHQALLGELTLQERRAALEKMIFEAGLALAGGRLTVQTSPADAALLAPALIAGLQGRLAQAGAPGELAPGSLVDIAGGAIVSKDGGRVIFDNSFEARLARLGPTLRNDIWQVLAGSVEVVAAPLDTTQEENG